MKKHIIPLIFALIVFATAPAARAEVIASDSDIITISGSDPAQTTAIPAPEAISTPSAVISEEPIAPELTDTVNPTPNIVQPPAPEPTPTPTPTPIPTLEPAEPFESDFSETEEAEQSIALDFALDNALGVPLIEIKGSNGFREIVGLDDEGTARISVPVQDMESLSFVFAKQSDLTPKRILDESGANEYQPKGQEYYESGQTSEVASDMGYMQGVVIIVVISGAAIYMIYKKIKKTGDTTDNKASNDHSGLVGMEEETESKPKNKVSRAKRAEKKAMREAKKTKRSASRKASADNDMTEFTKQLSELKSRCSALSIEIHETDDRCEFIHYIDSDTDKPDIFRCALNFNSPDEAITLQRMKDFSGFLEMVWLEQVTLTRGDLLGKEMNIRGLSHKQTDHNGEPQYIFWF